jgi:hypothetical protein
MMTSVFGMYKEIIAKVMINNVKTFYVKECRDHEMQIMSQSLIKQIILNKMLF